MFSSASVYHPLFASDASTNNAYGMEITSRIVSQPLISVPFVNWRGRRRPSGAQDTRYGSIRQSIAIGSGSVGLVRWVMLLAAYPSTSMKRQVITSPEDLDRLEQQILLSADATSESIKNSLSSEAALAAFA